MGKIAITRNEYLSSIAALKQAAQALAGSLSLTQLSWQPKNGESWSVLECLDHLAIATSVYLDAMEPAILGAPRGKSPGLLQSAGIPSTLFLRKLEPPVTRKAPAPAKIRPRPTLNPESILPGYLKAMDRVTSFVNNTADRDLNAVRFRNPLIPVLRLTLGTGLLIIAGHGRRHLWQAEQVSKEPDFPKL